MILSKILHSLYAKIYIGIILSGAKTQVCVHTLKGNKLEESYMQLFDGRDVSEEMSSYIASVVSDTPYYYISLLDYSSNQGAASSCDEAEFRKYSDSKTSQHICHGDWNSFTSKVDIIDFEKKYDAFGLDFIFSPYTVLTRFFKDKTSEAATLFVLVQEDSLAMCIFEESKLKYSEFVDMRNDTADENIGIIDDNKDDMDLDLEDIHSVNLEDIDVDEGFAELDDLTDIEDLDNVDELEDFTEVRVDAPQIDMDIDGIDSSKGMGFNDNYRRFSAIQSALNEFYSDPKYENKFIETVYIAAACTVEKELKSYLEDELFLRVHIRQLNMCEELFELAKGENI